MSDEVTSRGERTQTARAAVQAGTVRARATVGPAAPEPRAEQPQRGRPRSEKARKAILDATAELLLARGLSAVSMDAVAEQAGVSKATIYRWWPTKETLALDALYTEWAGVRPAPRDTGTLRGDLLSLLRPWARLVGERPHARVIAALLSEAQMDPAFAEEYRHHVVEPRRELATAVFLRAAERGEIDEDTKIDVALDLIYGPLYHRLLHGHAKLTDRFVQDVVDMALNGIARTKPA
jgi:AcrR family transcriptional regulator